MGIFDGYLLVSDMDGTLLNSKGKLSEENKKAIEYFVDNGGQFTLATGRMLPSIKRHIHKMKVTLPVIMYNGTKVYDFNGDEVIWEKFLEEERKNIVKAVKEFDKNVGIEIYSDETVYIYQQCSRTERFSKLGYDVIYDIDDSIWSKKWTKALIIGEKEELDSVESYLKNCYRDNDIVRSADVYLEIIPKEISKGQALNKLIEHKGMSEFTVVTVGDNMNDVELLEEADAKPVSRKAFSALSEMVGGVEILEEAKKVAPSKKAMKAIRRLEKIYAILSVYKMEQYITFDLSMSGIYGYYTGIIFRGYTFGTGDAIVKGGRYDHLVEKFGKAEPAIGFAIVVDELMSALSRQKIQISSGEKSSLILYDKERLKDAIQLAMEFRGKDKNTQILQKASDKSLEFYVDYGKRSLAGSMLYLRSKGDVQMVNLMTGEEKIVG